MKPERTSESFEYQSVQLGTGSHPVFTSSSWWEEESWSRTPGVSGVKIACNNVNLYAFKEDIKHLDEAQRQSEAGEVCDCAARSVTFLQTCQQRACVCVWVA